MLIRGIQIAKGAGRGHITQHAQGDNGYQGHSLGLIFLQIANCFTQQKLIHGHIAFLPGQDLGRLGLGIYFNVVDLPVAQANDPVADGRDGRVMGDQQHGRIIAALEILDHS